MIERERKGIWEREGKRKEVRKRVWEGGRERKKDKKKKRKTMLGSPLLAFIQEREREWKRENWHFNYKM